MQASKAPLPREQSRFGYTRFAYIHDLRDKRNLLRAGEWEWGWLRPKDIRKQLTCLRVYVHSWVTKFAASEPEDVERLSDTQKCDIISSLKGYCVQEDWDILMGHLSDVHRDLIMEVFLETLLMKEIIEKTFECPFWYFDGKLDLEDEEGDETFGARLQHLYERFLKSMYANAPVETDNSF